MKIKTLKLLFVMMTVASSFAQTEKGKFLIGLNTPLSFSNSSSRIIDNSGNSLTNESTSTFTFSPQIGYSIIDNLFVGIDATLSFSSRDNEAAEFNSTSYILSPFVKYYYPSSNDFNFFGQFKYGFGQYTSELNTIGLINSPVPSTQISESNMEELVVGLGIGYFVHEILNIELSINYQNTFYDSYANFNGNQLAIDTFGASIGFSLFL
ncbi:outer membrane protein with beta-barrel domain [Tenacibaculum skagerrakense]|uniref:Outer membrane protein with beta-barrel domain n=1 Tax=Tenacibaculum skagerrakense TaxID=186571 RepID=A0A4R2NMV5_9FLAO|nr:outer membrane beta-barrel protein [Tenacibaculum skagerrakense]TCP22635.1 outer membrane protein with beta-barrel domain [Tenacibaculum skagerrakense]